MTFRLEKTLTFFEKNLHKVFSANFIVTSDDSLLAGFSWLFVTFLARFSFLLVHCDSLC